MRSPLLLPAALVALALAGCSIGDDGPRRTETRDVDAFTRVASDSSVELRLHVGEPRQVRVRAGEKVIDDVGTEVRDGTLHVTFDHDGWGGNDVVVEASVPKLEGIDVEGSGDVEADGIDADMLEVSSEGSADLVLTGTVDALDVEVEGSGNADLADLTARAARVKVRGSGDADVRADERLDVDVDGSGNVRYHGDPELNQRVDGSGDLSRADS
jgi:Putative auto-transporter adhesin, head GIN domain